MIETHLKDVSVVAHPGHTLNTEVDWSELSAVEFLVNGSRWGTHQLCSSALLVAAIHVAMRLASAHDNSTTSECICHLPRSGTSKVNLRAQPRSDPSTLPAWWCHQGHQRQYCAIVPVALPLCFVCSPHAWHYTQYSAACYATTRTRCRSVLPVLCAAGARSTQLCTGASRWW